MVKYFMRKFFVSVKQRDSSFIAPSLAIISIIAHLMFPQYTIIAKTNNNTKTSISQGDINPEKPKVMEESVLSGQENKTEDGSKVEEQTEQTEKVQGVQIETIKKQSEKIPAAQAESLSDEKNKTENNQTINKTPIEEVKIKNKKSVLVTAYSSTVDQTDSTPFITASGTHVHDGTIAANFLKFGTKVKFPSLYGDKIFTVEDRMKSDYKVDIWFPTRQEAKNFGVKRVEMEIL